MELLSLMSMISNATMSRLGMVGKLLVLLQNGCAEYLLGDDAATQSGRLVAINQT